MKTVFLIAGFNTRETATDKYKLLIAGLEAKGYRVIPVDISWYHKVHSQFIKEFVAFYNQHKGPYNIIIGNSFGAVVGLLAAPELQPDELVLCSLSPYFKEDRGKRPDDYAYKHFGKRRAHDLWSYSFDAVAERLNQMSTKVIITYGEQEHHTSPPLVSRCQDAGRKLKQAQLFELPNTPHNLRSEAYTTEILKLF